MNECGTENGRVWDTDAERERKRLYREKRALEQQDEGLPWQGLVSEAREQAIRAHYGYASSETRTQAERQEAATRILR